MMESLFGLEPKCRNSQVAISGGRFDLMPCLLPVLAVRARASREHAGSLALPSAYIRVRARPKPSAASGHERRMRLFPASVLFTHGRSFDFSHSLPSRTFPFVSPA